MDLSASWREFVMKKTGRPNQTWRLMTVFWLLILGCYFMTWYATKRLLGDLSLSDEDAFVWEAIMAVCTIAVPLSMFAPWIRNKPLQSAISWIGLPLMGFLSTLVVLTVLRDFFLWGVAEYRSGDMLRYPEATAGWVISGAIFLSVLGFFNARRTPRAKHFKHEHKTIPEDFDGYRVVQISDVHVGPTIGRGHVAKIVRAVNKLKPDAVVITGDLVDGHPEALEPAMAPFRELRARHGVFFVPGNHDYYSGIHRWMPVYSRLGFKPLMNAHHLIKQKGSVLVMAGVTDHKAHLFAPDHKSCGHKALEGAPSDAPVIMLAHQPVQAKDMPSEKITLQLSGHTHGGQFWPWSLAVPLQQPQTAGFSTKLGHPVYVNRGTGYWGPPKRILSPSEITLITLHSRKS